LAEFGGHYFYTQKRVIEKYDLINGWSAKKRPPHILEGVQIKMVSNGLRSFAIGLMHEENILGNLF